MEKRRITTGLEARRIIKRGVDIVADTVKSTLGPHGKYVVIDFDSQPHLVTNDGVTVARNINLPDELENLGAKLIKEVAIKTNEDSGDGTTTATVLAQSMLNSCNELLSKKSLNGSFRFNPARVKLGITEAVKRVIELIKVSSKAVSSIKDIERIATISANDSTIGKIIGEAYEKVGYDGMVLIDESRKVETEVEIVEGLHFDRGYVTQYFVTDPIKMKCMYDNCGVLIVDDKISNIQDVLHLFKKYVQNKDIVKPLLIIAHDFDPLVIATMVQNKLKGVFPCVAVKAPSFGDKRKDILADIAIITGARVISKDIGKDIDKASLDDIGVAQKIMVDKDNTTIVVDKTPEIRTRIEKRTEELKTRLAEAIGEYEGDKIRERISKLNGGVAVINVGGKTETEMTAKKYKIEDAVHAVRSAIEEGVSAGAGYTYLLASTCSLPISNDSDINISAGMNVVVKALVEPAKTILLNGGYGLDNLSSMIKYKSTFNSKTGELCLVTHSDVIDPTKTLRVALENAASIACLYLETSSIMTILPEKQLGKQNAK